MMKSFQRGIGLLILSALLLFSHSVSAGQHRHHTPKTPLIFVHGGAGSASQFESQAMRLTSNGYPQKLLFALEYDSSFRIDTVDAVHNRLDQLISRVQAQTGASQVDVMGHSLGTYVLNGYLTSSPERAANVAHYVNLDGYSAAAEPGGVPTLALWAEIGEGGHVGGAMNITVAGQTHVETATSAESFGYLYEFLTGKKPRSSTIRASRRPFVSIAGRAVLFPYNIGVDGARVEVYEVDGTTGQRLRSFPKARFEIDSSGEWGPFFGWAGAYYEFVIVREGQEHHIYKQPFLRDDHFVRLLTSAVGGGISANVDSAPEQSNLIISRDKEFWGERPLQNDVLTINGISVINAANSPFSNRTNVLYFFDQGSDGDSDLSQPIPYFHGLPFITGNDLFIPSSDKGDDRIRLTLTPRGGNGALQVLNVPNWPSPEHRITVMFNDFVQDDSVPR
ncbi:alpha/beta hydrolase [Ketobacter alkanivorans]|nr:alpha/beta hydrolase [Ketobacter alkanivorans]